MTKETAANNIETEYLQLNSRNNWTSFYQQIRSKSATGPNTEALKPQNKGLNRYRDVLPYDHSRVTLQRGSTDYINANLCKVEKAKRQYILTQGPLATTVSHFWLMVWEQDSRAVLMLNKLIEKKAEKCYQYWPSAIGGVTTFNDVGLTLEYVEQQDHSYYLTRVLRLKDIESGAHRDILQFHYTTWPDFGVPSSPTIFLDFLKKVRRSGVLEQDVGPPVVHCSAGIGRSGTFCLVDSCLVLIEKYGLNSVNVEEVLLELRTYRTGLIQTHEQLRFSYQAIIEGAKQLLNSNSDEENDLQTNHVNDGGDDLIDEAENSDEDNEPPPLPPPRTDSLKAAQNGLADRPLPTIPQSVSDNDLTYKENGENGFEDKYIPSGPLPGLPVEEEDEDEGEGSSEDSLIESIEEEEEEEDEEDDQPGKDNGANGLVSDQLENETAKSSSAELRHRRREERKQNMEQRVRDMKRRQQENEQWQQLKRSICVPILVSGAILIGGGFVYLYLRNSNN